MDFKKDASNSIGEQTESLSACPSTSNTRYNSRPNYYSRSNTNLVVSVRLQQYFFCSLVELLVTLLFTPSVM